MLLKTLPLCWMLVVGSVCLGCNDQKAPPIVASSSGQSGYATRYPDEISASRGRMDELEGKSRQMMQNFSNYPEELKNPSWSHVAKTVELADDAGRSSAYVERLEETEATARFFSDEKAEISRSVAGAASYAAKQKGCQDVDAYGASAHALEKSVEKQLEKRLRERNEAHQYIEDNQEALGKDNLEKLRKQADEISYVSYMTKVGVPQTRERMQTLIDEASGIKSTLDRTIEESKTVEADAKRSNADKAAAKKRRESAEAAKQRVDSEVQQAQHVMEQVEERAKKLSDEYDQALDALKKKIEEKQKAEPQKPAA
jgi:hypothetical protein